VTDRQTDGQTTYRGITELSVASRVKIVTVYTSRKQKPVL